MLLLCLLAASGGQRCVSGAYCPVGAGLARLLRGERVGSGAGAARACRRGRNECVGAAGSSAMRLSAQSRGRAPSFLVSYSTLALVRRGSFSPLCAPIELELRLLEQYITTLPRPRRVQQIQGLQHS